jgi:hypothetical protein
MKVVAPPADDAGTDQETDRQAEAMKSTLQGDVASWSAARNENVTQAAAEFRVPVTKSPAPKAAASPRKSRAAVPADKAVVAVKKPFSMAYDGVTVKEHIQYLIDHGAR